MTAWQKTIETVVFAVAGGSIAGATGAFISGESDPKKIRNAAIAGAGVTIMGLLRQWRPDLFKVESTQRVTQTVTETPTTTETVESKTTTVKTDPVEKV